MAVAEPHQGRGIGRALVEAAVALARNEARKELVVTTAAADIGNLRFYQRLGVRMRSIERDAFTPATGYEPSPHIDGIELRDWAARPAAMTDARFRLGAVVPAGAPRTPARDDEQERRSRLLLLDEGGSQGCPPP